MVNVNLESIRECFPKLKRFIARIRENEIRLIADKHNLSVDIDKVLECLQNLFVIVAFGETHKRYDIDIPIECIGETVEWLGQQNIGDTTILLDRFNMIDRENDVHKALSELYGCLIDSLEEV